MSNRDKYEIKAGILQHAEHILLAISDSSGYDPAVSCSKEECEKYANEVLDRIAKFLNL